MTIAAKRHRKRIAAASSLTIVAAVLSAGVALAGPATADQNTDTLAGTSPSYATAAADQGQTAGATAMSVRVFLNGQDAAGLAAYAQAVSDPNSASYKQYLSPAQVQQRYGSTAQQVAAVTNWLKGAGLTVASSNAHWLDVTGDAAAVQKAFSTQLHNYATPKGTLHAPQHDAQVPKSVSAAILGVSGLAQSTTKAVTMSTKSDAKPTPAPSDPSCSSYFGEKKEPTTLPPVPAGFSNPTTLAECSLYPAQLREAYGVTKDGLTGKGATVAIINWYGSTTMQADANQYSTNHGDKPFAPGQYTEISDSSQWTHLADCGGVHNNGEEALDVEMAHGMAPDAKIVSIAANSCYDSDLLAAEALAVDKRVADVVSNSWGESMFSTSGDIDPATMKAYDKIFQQGALEGMAFTFSSGDCMNNDAKSVSTGLNCDATVSRASVDWPTSSAWVTSVGGTALGLDKKGGYSFETPMGDARSGRTAPGATAWAPASATNPVETFGAGGGVSELTPQPWYQSWSVPRALSTTLMDGTKAKQPMRTIPDVALNGDLYFSSTLVGSSDNVPYSEAGFGGTSVSTPMFAGLLADAQQAQWGIPVGFANPAIYLRGGTLKDVVANPKQIGNSPIHSVIFEYPASSPFAGYGRLIQYGVDEGLPASKGYDLATGLGSPDAQFLRSFGNGR